jgi:protein-L-isoaspartate(D-aspartate) O-methyltransferase
VACSDETGSPADLVRAARRAGVADQRVLAAIAAVPRSAFVPERYAAEAYADRPLPIPHGQVTTQPSLSAIMIAGLGLIGSEDVLEVGTGYGYQTALLSRLSATVVSVEYWPDIAAQARDNLRVQGIHNVLVVAGDGSEGYAAGAPYDAVLVSAAFPQVPPPLVSQLRAGGRLVQPVGPGGHEKVVLFERRPEGLTRLRTLTSASFVRLHGRFGYRHAHNEGHRRDDLWAIATFHAGLRDSTTWTAPPFSRATLAVVPLAGRG